MNPEPSTPPRDIAAEGTAFVAELNPAGTALLYSTYLGGSGNGTVGDLAEGIAVDTASPANIYVTGDTFSPDFPVSTNAIIGQPGPAGTSNGGSAFVTKLNPSLTGAAQLVYSTYLGGDTFDDGHGIAVDASRQRLRRRRYRIHEFSGREPASLLSQRRRNSFSDAKSIPAPRLVQLHWCSPPIWAEAAWVVQQSSIGDSACWSGLWWKQRGVHHRHDHFHRFPNAWHAG